MMHHSPHFCNVHLQWLAAWHILTQTALRQGPWQYRSSVDPIQQPQSMRVCDEGGALAQIDHS
jgi:hypothetical protein